LRLGCFMILNFEYLHLIIYIYIYILWVESIDFDCDFRLCDLDFPFRFNKTIWVESTDFGCDLRFFDLTILFRFKVKSRFWQPCQKHKIRNLLHPKKETSKPKISYLLIMKTFPIKRRRKISVISMNIMKHVDWRRKMNKWNAYTKMRKYNIHNKDEEI
jgi:hypothetical protein